MSGRHNSDQGKHKTRSLQQTDQATQENINPRHAALHQAIRDVYKPGNMEPTKLGLFVSVQAELRRYHLETAYSAGAIISEAFLRGIKAIDSGKPMPHPIGWLRLASRHIIKEKIRGQQKELQLDNPELFEAPGFEDDAAGDHLTPQHQKVRQDFRRLSRLDQDILMLKVAEELRWEAVQMRLIAMGHGEYSKGALRQRKRRALQQLRNLQ